jgi:hypothetical protein
MKHNVVYDFDTYFPAVTEDRKNIESQCNDITFYNNTDGTILINNLPITSGEQLILTGNEFEFNVSKFQLTNSTATTGTLYVVRKRYL